MRKFFTKSNLALLLTLSVTLAAFFPVIFQEFNQLDLNLYILENPIIQSFSRENLQKIFSIHIYWMPLTWLSYMLDYYFSGQHPQSYHIQNLCWHLANTTLVYFILKRCCYQFKRKKNLNKKDYIIISIATLCWALHPMRVEAVAWAVNRKGLISSFFFFATLLSYIHVNKKKQRLFLSCLCGSLAMSAHPNTLTLPFILILIDIYRENFKHEKIKFTTQKILSITLNKSLEKWPLFLMSLFTAMSCLIGQSDINALQSTALITKINHSLYQITFYLKEVLLPFNINTIYNTLPIEEINLLTFFNFISILTLCLYCIKKKSLLLNLSLSYFLICILPTLGIIQAGWITHADRWTYVALLPFSILICKFLLHHKGCSKKIFILSLIPILTLLSIQQKELKLWSNNFTAVNHANQKYDSPHVYFQLSLAQEYLWKKEHLKATALFNQIQDKHPGKQIKQIIQQIKQGKNSTFQDLIKGNNQNTQKKINIK